MFAGVLVKVVNLVSVCYKLSNVEVGLTSHVGSDIALCTVFFFISDIILLFIIILNYQFYQLAYTV